MQPFLPPRSLGSALARWCLWVALSTAGFALGFALGFPLAFLGGIPYGAAQWLLLLHVRGLRFWTLVTALTFPFLLIGITLGLLLAPDPSLPSTPIGWLVLATPVVAFAPMAVAQWLLLRKDLRRAALWVPASMFGWLLGLVVLAFGDGSLGRQGPASWFGLLPNELPLDLNIAPIAAIQAAVTGAALLVLPPRVDAHGSGA